MGKPSPPPAPNYQQSATQQGVANTQAAQQSAFLSNPNIISPYGSQTVSWNPVGSSTAPSNGITLNADGTAPVQFQFTDPSTGQLTTQTLNLSQSDLQGSASPELQQILGEGGLPYVNGHYLQTGGKAPDGGMVWVDPSTGQPNSLYNFVFPSTSTPGSSGVPATNPDGTQNLQATITQSLNPISTQTLTQEQLAALGLASTANTAQGSISHLLSQPFQTPGNLQTSLDTSNAPIWMSSLSPDLFQQTSGAGAQYATPGITPNLFGFGMAQGGVNGPNLQGSIDTSGVAGMPVNPGMSGQQAIMSRLQPMLDAQRAQQTNRLTQQGLVSGDSAYDAAVRQMDQQQNDAMTQAVLQGMGLDFQANQQGFNEAQAQAQFGNQAQLSGFGAALQNQGAGNQAVQQNQQTALAYQQAYNQALGQGFSQSQAMQMAYNQSIQQNLSNYNTQQQLQNSAQQQYFNQLMQSGQFANAAQQQWLQEALQQRDLPINEITALLSGSQVQNPQFQAYQGATVAPAPVFNATQAQGWFAQQNYQNQVAAYNGLMGGLSSLAGGLMGAFTPFSFGGKSGNTQAIGY